MSKLSRILAAAFFAALLSWTSSASAQEKVQFQSYFDNGLGKTPTTLDGYLFKSKAAGKRPAVVFLHGCWGLFDTPNKIEAVERQWQQRLNAAGFHVLMVDSNTPRGIKETCSVKTFQLPLYLKRTNDAYGALQYLQQQDFVRPDGIALMGWDAGGGVVLLTIGKDNPSRPATLALGDFRAAVAVYPSVCDDRYYVAPWTADKNPRWTSEVPLLILDGGRDVWTPAKPCAAFVEGARARGAKIELKIYPRAYHAFDAPGLRRPVKFPAYARPYNVTPILGTDPKARADALKRVPEFLAEALGK